MACIVTVALLAGPPSCQGLPSVRHRVTDGLLTRCEGHHSHTLSKASQMKEEL